MTYESLAKAERSELHERFAGWLEDRTAERADEFDEILGYHLQQAHHYRTALGPLDDHGRVLAERAASRLSSAGTRAHARGDMWGAAKLLAAALQLLPERSDARPDL